MNRLLLTACLVPLAVFAAPLPFARSQAVLVNLPLDGCVPLVRALGEAGLSPGTATATDPLPAATRLVVWEAKQGEGTDLSPDTAAALAEQVRQGAALLVTLDARTGSAPMRLASVLPAIPWHTQAPLMARGGARAAISAISWDKELFPHDEPAGLVVPHRYDIAPCLAVERGIARYDIFAYRMFGLDHAAGDYLWTRPLLNRDWEVRLRAGDTGGTPLLVTGRYGAGRVAVYASTARQAADEKGGAFWGPLLAWLIQASPPPAPASAAGAPPELRLRAGAADAAGQRRQLETSIRNPSATPLSTTLLVRFLTWEGTYVADARQEVTIPAKGEATVRLPFPGAGPAGYQALDALPVYEVRAGLLAADQRSLLAETVASVDTRPPLVLTLESDNLRTFSYPFPSLDPDSLPSMRERMGAPVGAYAYPPGAVVHASVTIANGPRNLTPLSVVADETQPANPTLAALRGDYGQAEKGPRDAMQTSDYWRGQMGTENSVTFTFPRPVWVDAVVLDGEPVDHHRLMARNPGAAVIECDGVEKGREDHLDARFASDLGLVRIEFPAVRAKVVRLRLPWIDDATNKRARTAPELGSVAIQGWEGDAPPAQRGTLRLALRDALTGRETPVGEQEVSVAPGERKVVALPFSLPPKGQDALAFYRLTATFQGQSRGVPLMAAAPAHTVLSLASLRPDNAPMVTFTVTPGFRNVSDVGTGSQEFHAGAWAQPDDGVWAWSHGLKQITAGRGMPTETLFVAQEAMSHYANPWTLYRNGEPVLATAAPHLVERMKGDKRWSASDCALFGFSDRWDSGPSMYSMFTWQDLVAFDQFLRSQGQPGLKGSTHAELSADVNQHHDGEWQSWQMERYVKNVEAMRQAFAGQGKRLVISGQGIPLLRAKEGEVVGRTMRGMSDDNTWGMADEDIALTTGRQMAYMAYGPWLALSSNYTWGWNSATLENTFWFGPVGTTEPSRRHYYDRAWRGTIGGDGSYRSIFSYGFNMNGGASYCMATNDWQQDWTTLERMSLIYPEAPVGAGLLVSTAMLDEAPFPRFSGGGMGESPTNEIVYGVAGLFGKLVHAGLSIPFSSGVANAAKWEGNAPMIVADLSALSPNEVAALRSLTKRGVPLAAFQGAGPLSPEAAELFGVHPDGTADGAKPIGQAGPASILARDTGGGVLIAGDSTKLGEDAMRALAPILTDRLRLPLRLPEGTAGYGFSSGGLTFVALEDWREEGRTATIRLRAGQGTRAAAVDVNEHLPLPVRREGADWLVDVPLRPGDGVLVAISEKP